MMMPALPFHVDREVTIRATPEMVFRFFTDSEYWARWWGPGSVIDARPGGRLRIRYPGSVEATGEVLALEAPERIVFTYGYASGQPIAPGASRVTIRLDPTSDGTRVRLSHEVADAAVRDEHVQGWRYQMAVFSVAVTNVVNAGADAAVDAWFRAWSDPDTHASERTLAEVAAPTVTFRDQFSNLTGIADVLPHLAAARKFMPGISLKRIGDVRHCQGTALADWVAVATDGAERSRGTNVFVFGPTGKIESVTGVWARHPGAAG
jgi:uncharacterized protein YndB with AHSA1/START domain